MDIVILPTREKACELAARLISDAVSHKPNLVLGLATGRTMESVYSELVKISKKEGVSYSKVTSFNLDEYIGLKEDHPDSYRHYMNSKFFSKIDIDIKRTHVPNGIAPDIDNECLGYEQTITNAGGIDLQLLGLGEEGHIGFNEPLSALRSRTRAKSLSPGTLKQNRHLLTDASKIPTRAITMGVGTILDSKRCLLLVTGTKKAEILAKAVEGPITAMISATALQLHPRCTVIVDEEASRKLTQKEYYKWTFENEPEWDLYRKMLKV